MVEVSQEECSRFQALQFVDKGCEGDGMDPGIWTTNYVKSLSYSQKCVSVSRNRATSSTAYERGYSGTNKKNVAIDEIFSRGAF